jgi:hypothetical protein
VSYAGPTDAVWAVWERGTPAGAASVVALHEHGKWMTVARHGIAVAANQAGDVIVQRGKYVSVGRDVPDFDTVPTGDAQLRHDGTTHTLGAAGSVFIWIRGSSM